MRGATEYLGGDAYVEDEETVTRIFMGVNGKRFNVIELTAQEAQKLFEVLQLSREKGEVQRLQDMVRSLATHMLAILTGVMSKDVRETSVELAHAALAYIKGKG